VQALAEGVNDPIFHLPPSAISPQEAALGAAAIAGRIGDNPAGLTDAYQQQLSELDAVLANCGAKVPSQQRMSIFDVPASIGPGNDDHIAEMRGPLNTAGTLTENLLLEYTEGFDPKDVGWGCVDGTKLRGLIGLHTAAFDIAQRTHAVAVAQVSPLLKVIDRSLQQAMTGKPIQGALGKPADKALFLVGHDTNLANLSGALGLDWLLDGRRNDTPPGSAIIFELWKDSKKSSYSIRVYFTAQTLEQMRELQTLDATHKPPKAPVFVPGCSRANGACTASSFQHAIENVIAATP
jgi:4-phytase/acid phosphatase